MFHCFGAFYRQPNTSLADIESLVTAVMDVRGNKTRVPEMIIGVTLTYQVSSGVMR